ncbi:MAG: flavodoxin [Brotaphodocola sp.]
MSKVAIVFWSGTGNTEAMANSVAAGAKAAGADVTVYTASEFHASMMDDYDAIAYGCPAMGSEELEDTEFQPMFDDCKSKLNGKKIGLFGSYSWAEGEWMRIWQADCEELGANLVMDGVICYETPDAEGEANCEALGKALA